MALTVSNIEERFKELDKENINDLNRFETDLLNLLNVTEDLDDREEIDYYLMQCTAIMSLPPDDEEEVDENFYEPQ